MVEYEIIEGLTGLDKQFLCLLACHETTTREFMASQPASQPAVVHPPRWKSPGKMGPLQITCAGEPRDPALLSLTLSHAHKAYVTTTTTTTATPHLVQNSRRLTGGGRRKEDSWGCGHHDARGGGGVQREQAAWVRDVAAVETGGRVCCAARRGGRVVQYKSSRAMRCGARPGRPVPSRPVSPSVGIGLRRGADSGSGSTGCKRCKRCKRRDATQGAAAVSPRARRWHSTAVV